MSWLLLPGVHVYVKPSSSLGERWVFHMAYTGYIHYKYLGQWSWAVNLSVDCVTTNQREFAGNKHDQQTKFLTAKENLKDPDQDMIKHSKQ